tara:strand:- start:707 stop:1126 length:420 start_codon:yes stop_codon:yes gene_type:complete
MDHDHNTGLFRKIVCRACNNSDSYLRHPNGYDKKISLQKYYQNHKEAIDEKNREYIKKNQESVKQSQQNYRDTHKTQSSKYNKVYKQQNKTKLAEVEKTRTTKKYLCLCGSTCSVGYRGEHMKTQKHLNNMDIYMYSLD